MKPEEKNLIELRSIIQDFSALKEMADKATPAELSDILPPQEYLLQLKELTEHLLFLRGWQKGMMLTDKYRKEEPKEKKKCTCQCHTWGISCAGFGSGDNNCCGKPHEKYPEWSARIDPAKKQKLMELYREEVKKIHSENSLNTWVAGMDIPEHIKKDIQHRLWGIGYHCANFEDVCQFDAEGCARWVIETLDEFL